MSFGFNAILNSPNELLEINFLYVCLPIFLDLKMCFFLSLINYKVFYLNELRNFCDNPIYEEACEQHEHR